MAWAKVKIITNGVHGRGQRANEAIPARGDTTIAPRQCSRRIQPSGSNLDGVQAEEVGDPQVAADVLQFSSGRPGPPSGHTHAVWLMRES